MSLCQSVNVNADITHSYQYAMKDMKPVFLYTWFCVDWMNEWITDVHSPSKGPSQLFVPGGFEPPIDLFWPWLWLIYILRIWTAVSTCVDSNHHVENQLELCHMFFKINKGWHHGKRIQNSFSWSAQSPEISNQIQTACLWSSHVQNLSSKFEGKPGNLHYQVATNTQTVT